MLNGLRFVNVEIWLVNLLQHIKKRIVWSLDCRLAINNFNCHRFVFSFSLHNVSINMPLINWINLINFKSFVHFRNVQQRTVSVQIPRQGQIQQRIVQSPFSPQSQAPQSPHNQFPLSPATSSHDQFSRPSSECSQDPYLNVSVFRLFC